MDDEAFAMLQAAPDPILERLQERAKMHKVMPLLADIQSEQQRREGQRRRVNAGMRKCGLYRIAPVPTIEIDPIDAHFISKGREVVGRRNKRIF